jgi:glucokinase
LGESISNSVIETKDYKSAESLLQRMATEIENLAKSALIHIVAVGMGCPGRIDCESGKVVWLKSKLEFLEGVAIAALLSDRLDCPVACDNDVNTILAGEMRFGAGRGYRDVAAVAVGTGIGGALFLNGHIVRGHNWAAGHFGFMSQNPQGPRHVCGNTGIVEEYASQSGILRQVRQALEAGEVSSLTESVANGGEPGLCELFDAADAGDSLACRLSERLTSELGVLVANLIYAFDPEIVLIGGGVVNCRPGILNAVRHEAANRLGYLPQGATGILPMALGDAAGILGGAALAMNALTQSEKGLYAQGELR